MGCKIQVKANPTTWIVNAGESIQEAINNASSGDTIFVHNGKYYEHVVINKSVSLIGEDIDFTVIDGNTTASGSVINITANNVLLMNFTIRGSGTSPDDSAIHIEYSTGNVISYNKIVNNKAGISLFSSSNNVISNNTMYSNSLQGIYLYSSSNNSIYSNVISNSIDGIFIDSSDNNAISGNAILENFDGLYLRSSGSNVISGNNILNNYIYGIKLAFSTGNTIYHNNFNNTIQVSNGLPNSWDYDGEGNYWSDYVGQDLNGDGIGDKAYTIDSNNQDNYPLMGMFSDFTITSKEEIYHVAVISNSTISKIIFEVGPETGNRILRFNATGANNTIGFCRITIPTGLMKRPYFVLIGNETVIPSLIPFSNETYACMYFTYPHTTSISIISSEMWRLYSELLDSYLKLQIDFNNLNMTYYSILANYSFLLGNYSQLQESYQELNSSYQEHLLDYSRQIQNLRNLMYIFAATAAIFIASTIYLSKRAHERS